MAHHTKDKGDKAVAHVIMDLTDKGYACFMPVMCEHLPFDLIAYKDGISTRIQVKYSTDGGIKKKTVWNDKHGCHIRVYDKNDFDYYAIYSPQLNIILYPSIQFGGKSIAYNVPNSAMPFYWYKDFLDFTDVASKRNYKEFGKVISFTQTDVLLASRIKRRKTKWPTKEELEKLVWEKPTSDIAKELSVSDSAIGKWARHYGISKPPRGYWAKVAAQNKATNPIESIATPISEMG